MSAVRPGGALNPTGTVRAEVLGAVLVLTLDRPEVRNAVDMDVARGIEAGIDLLEGSDDLHAGVLAATGPVFCAGADLRLLATGGPLPYTERGDFGGLVSRERSKPLIAAVDGPALAGGCELVLACDLVVASEAATFGLPEVRLGLFAGGGGLVRLARRLPTGVAMELALTGDPMPADRAFAVGLASRLVAPGQALASAVELAARIAGNPPISVAQSRSVVLAAARGTEDDGWAANAAAGAVIQAGEHFREGPQAFLDKRVPSWSTQQTEPPEREQRDDR
jgi:enoyl-CoA hydratase